MTGSILVVDDDEDVRSLIVLHLTICGYTVAECATVDAALDRLETERPDLVLTDLNFGSDTGARLVRRCLELAQPVILMTASVETSSQSLGIEGPLTILRKPFGLDDLTKTVEQVRRP